MADGTGKVRPAGASPDTAGDAVYMQLTAGQVSTTLQAGEDQTNDVMKVEQQMGFETVAASQTDQVLGATGAAGDYLQRIIVVVATAATAATSISPDGGTTDISIFPNSPGGGIGTYPIEVNAIATGAGWAVTTGAGVSVVAIGRFT